MPDFNEERTSENRAEGNTARLVKFHIGDPPKSPLKRGTYIPPFLRGARGDLGFRLQCVSPTNESALRVKVVSEKFLIVIYTEIYTEHKDLNRNRRC